MNKICKLFEKKSSEVLSVYFTAGFPVIDDTSRIMLGLQAFGVDMIEVGIPFSDPMADGPVIQYSNTVALNNGMNLSLLFEQLSSTVDRMTVPVILMGYLNPVMQYGFENFCRDCVRVGVDGIILPDLPFSDYEREYKPIADRYGLCMIMLITPETSPERIRKIDESTTGFIYMVSSASITGARENFNAGNEEYFGRIASMNLKNPRLTGFGISNCETLASAFANSSGAIVGSKFISMLDTEPTIEDAIRGLYSCLFGSDRRP
jgi:tryptophan synthase alpha chain